MYYNKDRGEFLKMGNITDYIKWRGDLNLKQDHFNEVDNLVLSELSYFNYKKFINNKKILVKELIAEYLKNNNKKAIEEELPLFQDPIPFLISLKDSLRYGDLKVFNYVNILSKKEDKQFSAISIELNYNTVYVAFKGTDSTLLGWKEDFNLSFMNEIPSQKEATKYVNEIPSKYKYIILGGHSKGGNLAVYAAVTCKKKIKKRIVKVYNNDGPGFLEDFINSKEYAFMEPKIITTVPEISIIGMLLTRKGDYKVVKSEGEGIWQHDALNWQVENNHFITIKEVDETSTKIKKMMQEWLTNIDKKDREIFTNTLFKILEQSKIETVNDLQNLSLRKISIIIKNLSKVSEENRALLIELLKELVNDAKKNFDKKVILKGLKTLGKKS